MANILIIRGCRANYPGHILTLTDCPIFTPDKTRFWPAPEENLPIKLNILLKSFATSCDTVFRSRIPLPKRISCHMLRPDVFRSA